MLLQYHDLNVRNVTPEDAPQLSLWWNDGRVMAHAGLKGKPVPSRAGPELKTGRGHVRGPLITS